MDALLHFGQTALGLVRDVLPIAAILIGFQVLILRRPILNPARVGVGMVLVLLGLALFHLMYMHFVIPGGVSEIDYLSIANRWTNPVSGFFWRFFDLSLLALGLSHGAIGVRSAINRSFKGQNARFIMTGGLAITYLLLLVSSAWIIFTFHG